VAVSGSPGDRYLKVDHAGEHGAVSIYKAQIWMAMFRAPDRVPALTQCLAHEMRHRSIFAAELARRGVARCRSYPLCAMGGFALGMLTGLLGRQAMAATTVAIEHVVLRHLAQQLSALSGHDAAASAAIRSIVDDEQAHHDRAARELTEPSLLDRLVMAVVRGSTESVIWLGMRL
jgi:ubiquinone biosynthesis monooxygenase Coq7